MHFLLKALLILYLHEYQISTYGWYFSHWSDPYVPTLMLRETRLTAVPLDDEHIRGADCVIIVTDHSAFDYASIVRIASLIVDTRNATAGIVESHIWRL